MLGMFMGLVLGTWKWAPAQERGKDTVERQLAELQKRVEDNKLRQRQEMEKRLGERHKTLLTYSVEELRYAIELKIREVYEGATVISDDDEKLFLGAIVDSYRSDSIFCAFGRHGSTFSRESIWNDFGHYGGTLSRHSPFNELTRTPPLIVKNNKVIGRLTVNKTIQGAVDPNTLKATFSK